MASDVAQLPVESASLSPLPETVNKGLKAIVILSLVSLISTFILLLALGRNLFFKWRKRAHGVQNQFLFLIFNLLLADFQQAIAFFINVEWLARDEIKVDTPSCFAQGWFVSVGDLSSGWWAVAIGLHTFSCVALGHKMKPLSFYSSCALIWVFVFAINVIGISAHPDDLYVRAGAWCWVNSKYPNLRLWGHYFWIFVAEFGTLFLYGTLFYIIRRRIKNNHFCPTKTAQATQAAYMMVVYPLVYVVCTLPLASARLQSIIGRDSSIAHLCLAGAMITSNGWLDVLVYCVTRDVFVFSDEAPRDDSSQAEVDIIETFQSPFPFWKDRQHFGTTTTIEAGNRRASIQDARSKRSSNACPFERYKSRLQCQGSTERLVTDIQRPPPVLTVKTETTVVVRSEPMELNDIAGITYARRSLGSSEKERLSFDTKGSSNTTQDEFH
ncbi:G protein-coupled glucose receptor regulating Gpa2-domain-containing protein [Macrophomina phaseolina]|uniref:G protein-coupled glucose receptor regulating Gpa2-domain-containing protein n=1 Tax=Macrophomina phaseolina TaxID=35725 RepID=A0ABQ8GIM9_9PEZI|nr:G protein-coupled glucose receptor regulating Gpa2-domain-containing protein [Macrophomina phaseolina]